MMQDGSVGEIVASGTLQFTAGCYTLYGAPQFGALVKAALPSQSGWVYGVVYDVITGSVPPGASVTVRGSSGLRDGAIYAQNPDLEQIMRTDFTALVIGFKDGETIHQYLPPQPPLLHYSVYACGDDEVRAFTEQLGYLHTILSNREIPADELAAASIRHARASRPNDATYSLRAGRQLALFLKEEYDRLRAILARIGVSS